MTEQKLPAVEPGHVSEQTLPRVEGQGVQDDIAHSEYPKWFQHRGTGAILVRSAEEEAMRQAESDALPPPADPTDDDLAKAELEKELRRPLTDLECMIGPASLLAFVRDKNTLLVFHPDMIHAHDRMDDDGGAIPVPPTEFTTAADHLEAPPVVIESIGEQITRQAREHTMGLSTPPQEIPEAQWQTPSPLHEAPADSSAYPNPPESAE